MLKGPGPIRLAGSSLSVLALAALGSSVLASKEIDPALLSLTDCPMMPGCPALILLDETEFSNEGSRTKYARKQLIKVFTQEGIDTYSDVEVKAQSGGWDVRNLEGRTIQPDGTSIPLKQDNIRIKYLRAGKHHERVKSATFPGVVAGSIIEYSYDILTEQNSYMTAVEWDVQQELPILTSGFTMKPGPFKIGWKQAGSEKVTVEDTSTHKSVTRLRAVKVPPIPDEPYGPPQDEVRARLYFDLPELMESWLGRFAGQIAGYTGEFIDATPGITEKVKELTTASDTPIEKVRKIYRFVQEGIGDEERRGEETEVEKVKDAKNAGEVLAHGYGDERERTLLFLSLVKAAGLDQRLLMIVGRGSGVFDAKVPDKDQFDSFAAAVKTGSEQWTFYDPATRHCPFGMIAREKEGGVPNALMIQPLKGAGSFQEAVVQNLRIRTNTAVAYGIAAIPFSAAAKNVLTRETVVRLAADGSADVEVTDQGSGLVDLDHRLAYEELDESARREKLAAWVKGGLPKAELTEAAFEQIDSFEKPAVLKYQIRIPDAAEALADKLILTPSLLHAARPGAFTAEVRVTPVHLPFRRKSQERIRIVAPEGYELDDLPAPVVVRDAPLVFTFSFDRVQGELVVSRRVEIDTAVWPAADYSRLRAFYQKLQEADRQVVVFKKASGS